MPSEKISFNTSIPPLTQPQRLDSAVHQLLPAYSRSRISQWIKQGKLLVNKQLSEPSNKVQGGEQIVLEATLEDETTWQAQAIPIDIVFEDDAILILNKAAGVVVHPAVGNRHHTLVNGLLHHHPPLAQVPRAGIVHRLDKDTTGLLVVAKTLSAHHALVKQLQQRHMQREYLALAQGVLTAGGTIEAPLGRHPRQRLKMAVVEHGKPATTHYRLIERFAQHTFLHVTLDTGRTHQIRVHMAYIHHPLVGDPLYCGRAKFPKGASPKLMASLHAFKRQALHATKLTLSHPVSGKTLSLEQPLPDDMQHLLQVLRDEQIHHS